MPNEARVVAYIHTDPSRVLLAIQQFALLLDPSLVDQKTAPIAEPPNALALGRIHNVPNLLREAYCVRVPERVSQFWYF